jgi:hypothetical protein
MPSTNPLFPARLALAIAAIPLPGCVQHLNIDPGVVADIQRCGVEIQMSSSLRLRVGQEARTRVITAGTLSEIKSTIFASVPKSDRLAVYNSYVACVSSRAALESEIADIDRRKTALVQEIRTNYPNVTPREIQLLVAFYDKEALQLRSGELIEARNTRTQTVYAILQIADRHHIDPGPLVGTSEYMMRIDSLEKRTPQELQRFMQLCLVAADKPLCQSAITRLR